MATLTFNGREYHVDHAVKGVDYVHGYDANGVLVASFDGVSDFSAIMYDGEYMQPQQCLEEPCNNVKFIDGAFKTASGEHIIRISHGYNEPTGGNHGDVYFQII